MQVPNLTSRVQAPDALVPKLQRLFDLSAAKIDSLDKSWKPSAGSSVYTVKGRYTSRGWTAWAQGFQGGPLCLAGGKPYYTSYGPEGNKP